MAKSRSLDFVEDRGSKVVLRVTARDKSKKLLGTLDREFPKFDPKLEQAIEHFGAKKLYEYAMAAWTIEAQHEIRTTARADEPQPESEAPAKATWQDALGL